MRHVLVIEDDYLTAQCVADIVMCAGASSVDIVGSEAEAVAAATCRPPSVIVSDVDLKQGGRAPNAVARIHALCGRVPTIFVTGSTEDAQTRMLATVTLAKPIAPHQLACAFQTVIGDTPPGCEVADVREAMPDKKPT